MGIFRGQSGVTELTQERRWTRSLGFLTVRRFQGSRNDLEALVGPIQSDALDFSIRQINGPVYMLEASFGNEQSGESEDAGQTFFELLSESEEMSVYDSNAFASLTTTGKTEFREMVKQYEAGEDVTATFSNAADSSTGGQLFGTYKIRDSYDAKRWVLRKTQTISRYQRMRWNPADAPNSLDVELRGVDTVFTTAQLIAFESSLDAQMVGALTYYATPISREFFRFGWLKDIPTLQQRAGNKLESTVDYRLGFWPSVFYNAYA